MNVNTSGPEFSPERRMLLYDSLFERCVCCPASCRWRSSTRTPIDLSSRVNRSSSMAPTCRLSRRVAERGGARVLPHVRHQARARPRFQRRRRQRSAEGRRGEPGYGALLFRRRRSARPHVGPETDEPITIVGVVEDVRQERLTERGAQDGVHAARADGVVAERRRSERGPGPDDAVGASRGGSAALGARSRRRFLASIRRHGVLRAQHGSAGRCRADTRAAAGGVVVGVQRACTASGLRRPLRYAVLHRGAACPRNRRTDGARRRAHDGTATGPAAESDDRHRRRGRGRCLSLWASRALSTFLFELFHTIP